MDKKNILFLTGFINVFCLLGLWYTFTQPNKAFTGPGLQLLFFVTGTFISALLYLILKIKSSSRSTTGNIFLFFTIIQLLFFSITIALNIC